MESLFSFKPISYTPWHNVRRRKNQPRHAVFGRDTTRLYLPMRSEMKKRSKGTSYRKDIRPMFRDLDIRSMKRKFDLSKYEDVSANADDILTRLRRGDMPCDGA